MSDDGMAKITIDFDCSTTPEWISSGGFHMWKQYAQNACQSQIVLPWEEARILLAFAKHIPGWNSGAVNHPNPLRVEDIEEEEAVPWSSS